MFEVALSKCLSSADVTSDTATLPDPFEISALLRVKLSSVIVDAAPVITALSP